MVFIPVVIGLGVSSLLWYWLFSPDHGFVNRILLGPRADRRSRSCGWASTRTCSLWAIIGSVTWKVIGFGMILFIGAIQAIPREIDEASMVDGASAWQRLTRVTLPLTMKTILLVTLISVIGSLLAFDQFYIMTAGPAAEPDRDLGVLRLPQLVPVPEAGLRGGAVARARAHRPRRHGRARSCSPGGATHERRRGPGRLDGGSAVGTPVRRIAAGAWSGRNRYLTAALCVACAP